MAKRVFFINDELLKHLSESGKLNKSYDILLEIHEERQRFKNGTSIDKGVYLTELQCDYTEELDSVLKQYFSDLLSTATQDQIFFIYKDYYKYVNVKRQEKQ